MRRNTDALAYYQLDISKRFILRKLQEGATKQMEHAMKWETDADNIDPRDIDSILFRNNIVDEFIETGNKYFLVASKGVGKTLLLKYKRHQLETSNHPGRIFIPIDRPYLDQVSRLESPTSQHVKYLRDWRNARDLWELSISLSCISHYYATIHSNPPSFWSEIERHSPVLKDFIITKRRWIPSHVFAELLNLPISTFRDFVNMEHVKVSQGLASVQSEMCIFIDQLDQALLHYNDWHLWQAVQIGLLEAAWDVMRTNPHIKIYTTMRQEAYADYMSPNKAAISGEMSFIEYTHPDLKQLVNRLVDVYENKSSYEDFLGFPEVENGYSGDIEKVFSYTYRHTLGRPRDLVSICSKISPKTQDQAITKDEFKHIVNFVGSEDIVSNIFEEVSPVLRSLSDENRREILLSYIPANVLTMKDMIEICRKFNNLIECPEVDCVKCAQASHPFTELYNIGLLGVVEEREKDVTGIETQHFLEPYRVEEYSHALLPMMSPYYFIHPCLNEKIARLRNQLERQSYKLLRITVGQGCEWGDRQIAICGLPAVINACTDIEIQRKLEDLLHYDTRTIQEEPSNSTLSMAFVEKARHINTLITEQFQHAAWAGLWHVLFELLKIQR
ncbi:MAG: hypothetical protein ABSB30_14790 [Terracidiphilus sp.]